MTSIADSRAVYMIAAVVEPSFGIVAGNLLNSGSDRRFQYLTGAGLDLSQLSFELAPGLLDGNEVGRVELYSRL